MTNKVVKSIKAGKPAPPVVDKNALQVHAKHTESADLAISQKLTSPHVSAALTMREFDPTLKQQNVNDLVSVINAEAQRVIGGGMDRAEEMLTVQAHTLDTIFNALAQRAARSMNVGQMQATDTYMRMALKAQSQCRTTLEALSEIKNPRTATFIKQQNVAGQQQVVNGQTAAHEKNITPTNELLEDHHGERLDTRAAATPGETNSKLATLATFNGAADAGRKAARSGKCA